MNDLEFRLLGPFEVMRGSRRLQVPGGKALTLLAMLAVHANTTVSLDRLIDALWGDGPPSTGVANLHVYVSNLRKALECGPELLARDRAGYVLRIDADQLDAARFESQAAAGHAALAGGDLTRAERTLRAALSLWRGPALAGFRDDPFAIPTITRLEESRLAAIEARIDAELALGRHRQLLAELHGLVSEHPLRERLVGQLMVSLYRADRQAEALRAFQSLRHRLADQLGIQPSAALAALDQQIVMQDPQLDWAAPPAALAQVVGTVRITDAAPFVGRGSELAQIAAAFTEAFEGQPRAVMIVGEPGIGKTRLALEAAARAEADGAIVLWGSGFEGEWRRPYGPIGEALDRYVAAAGADDLVALLGEPATVLAPLVSGASRGGAHPATHFDEERVLVYDALAQWLKETSSRAPTVLVIDDVQWVDRGTLELARYLLRTLSGQPLLILGTLRDTDLPDGTGLLDELLRVRSQPGYLEIRLDGLQRAAVAELARWQGLPERVADAIASQTAGNAFFVREILTHIDATGLDATIAPGSPLAEFVKLQVRPDEPTTTAADRRRLPTPIDVSVMIESRLSRLAEPTIGLLRSGAVCGPTFLLDVAAAAAGLDEAAALDGIDEAMRARIVEPGSHPDSYTFPHRLVRQALYAMTPPSRRLRVHRRVAEALERRAGPHPGPIDSADIARHYHESCGLAGAERGVAPALRAAEHAEQTGAHEEAAGLLQVALDLLDPSDPARPGLLARRAAALAWSLRFDEAAAAATAAGDMIAAAKQATAGGDLLGDAKEAADVMAEAATVIYQAGSSRRARGIAEQGLAYAGDRRDPTWALLTLIARQRRDDEVADDERRQAARILKATPESIPPFGFLYGAIEAVYDSRQEVLADPSPSPTALLDRAGDLQGARTAFERDARTSEEAGRLAWAAACLAEAARASAALGDIDHANALVARAATLAGRVGSSGWLNGVLLGAADEVNMVVDGRAGEAFQTTSSDFQSQVMHLGQGIGSGVLAAAYARTMARLGDTDAALASFESVIAPIQRTPPWVLALHRVVSDAAETLWFLDRTDHADVIEAALRTKVLEPDFRRSMMDGRLSMGRICALTGRDDEAREWFDEARRVLEAQGAAPLRAIVDFDEALLWVRRGVPGRAHALLDQATGAFHALGMTGWVGRAATLRAG